MRNYNPVWEKLSRFSFEHFGQEKTVKYFDKWRKEIDRDLLDRAADGDDSAMLSLADSLSVYIDGKPLGYGYLISQKTDEKSEKKRKCWGEFLAETTGNQTFSEGFRSFLDRHSP